MKRNFGIRRRFSDPANAPVWPLWVATLAAVTVINAATFLPPR